MIIADEPVNGLDPAHQISLMKTFRDRVGEGRSVVVSLHDLSLASHWCDRIIMLSGGALVADGSTEEVMTAACIRQVYGVESLSFSVSGRSLVVPTELAAQTIKENKAYEDRAIESATTTI